MIANPQPKLNKVKVEKYLIYDYGTSQTFTVNNREGLLIKKSQQETCGWAARKRILMHHGIALLTLQPGH